MSEFLAFDSFLVPLGASVEDVKSTVLASLTTRGWQIVGNGIAYDSLTNNGVTNPAYMFNNQQNVSTSSYTSKTTLPFISGVKLTTAKKVYKYTICNYNYTSDPLAAKNTSPSAWTLEYSDDNVSWTAADTRTDTSWTGRDEYRTYTVANVPATGKLYWRINVTSVMSGTTCYIADLKLYTSADDIEFVCATPCVYMIPPASEQIGSAYQREIVAFFITSTKLSVRAGIQLLQPTLQTIALHTAIAGANITSLTLEGSTVSISLPDSGATSEDNLRSLFVALRDSTDPKITNWTWVYQKPPAQNASDAKAYIYGQRNSYAHQVTPVGTNCTVSIIGVPREAGFTPAITFGGINTADSAVPTGDLTIDLISGFIYYLQINKRGFALATKTNTSFYGPVHACYGDHAAAVASVPATPFASMLNPIELVVGADADGTSNIAGAHPAKYWTMGVNGNQTISAAFGYYDWSYAVLTPRNGCAIRSIWTDSVNYNYYSGWSRSGCVYLELSGLENNASENAAVIDDFQIHVAKLSNVTSSVVLSPYGANNFFVLPPIHISDWYKFRGTATSESLMLAADTVVSYSLAEALPKSSTGLASVALVSAAGLNPTGGFVVLEDEVLQYDSISGNNLLNVTRARYGSAAQKHWVGDKVYQALWYTVINGGALLCGFTKPA